MFWGPKSPCGTRQFGTLNCIHIYVCFVLYLCICFFFFCFSFFVDLFAVYFFLCYFFYLFLNLFFNLLT